jgi:uncharacterized membrane protein (DUF4010 family)
MTELIQRIGIALAIGFLVGVERGWRERDEADGSRAAGVRTFALIGLLGGIAGALYPMIGSPAFGLIALAFAAGFLVFEWRESVEKNNVSATEMIAGLLTFLLGAYAVLGRPIVAGAAGVATTFVLATREGLHGFVRHLSWAELRSAILLLAMSVVVLPVLPDRFVDPWGLFNPHKLWLMTIMIAAFSYAGYVAVKFTGPAQGLLLAGAAGGMVSSTAVTVSNARLAKKDTATCNALANGIVAAWIVCILRAAVIAVVVAPQLLFSLAFPIGAAALAAAVVALVRSRRLGNGGPDSKPAIRNPFDLGEVLRFGAILAVVMAAVKLLMANFGEAGLFTLAAITGLVEMDPITLSAGQMLAAVGVAGASLAILIAMTADLARKLSLGIGMSGGRLAVPLSLEAAAMFAAGGGAYAIMTR